VLEQAAISPTAYDRFRIGREFASEPEAQKAREIYQQAGTAENGLVIGHDEAPINAVCDGWQALRISRAQWTPSVNMAWIDGATDAGLPVRLVTPFEDVYRGSTIWDEIERVISRGGILIAH
jgi:hypothetical protein